MGLTDLKIKKLSPGPKRYEVPDGQGLSIRVMPSGVKSWIFRYTFDGVRRRMALGGYPGVTLADARVRHGDAMKKLQRGVDPGAEAKEAKAKRKAAPTFEDLLDEFWEKELKNQLTADERKRLVEKDAMPAWRKRRVASITRRDAVLLVDKVRERAPVTANRLQGVLVRMLNFAAERGIIENSPLAGLRRPKEESRSRVLENEEIKSLWAALDLENKKIDIYVLTKLALKLVLLTGQRPGEVASMRWDQLAGDWWTIPAVPDSKKHMEENKVPLLPMAKEVIETARIYSGDSPFVFRSSYKEKAPLTPRAMSNAIRRHREEMGIKEHFTPHDLRRTLRTRLAELGIEDVVAEKVLNHKLQGVLRIYNRYEYLDEKRAALAKWERRLKEILRLSIPKNGNVVSLEEVRQAK